MRPLTRFLGLCVVFGGTGACTAILGSFEVGGAETTSGEAGTAADGGEEGAVVVDSGGDDGAPATCPEGQVLLGGKCVTACQPGGNECGAHGKCVDGPNGFTCKCDAQYSGPACSACATGFQDEDGDGVCKATCAIANLTCPAQAKCSTATGVAVCTCPAGYVLDATPMCSWTGVIKDPTFQGTPANAWSVQPNGSTGVSFDTTGNAAGALEPGFAVFSGAALCTSSNRPAIVQTFDMPTPQESGAMSLTVSSSATYPSGGVSGGGRIGAASGASTSLFWSLGPTNTFDKTKICLGELAYGKQRSLQLLMFGSGCPGNTTGMQGLLDHVSIAPDQMCPAVGQVFNGDFEAGASGWTSLGSVGSGSASVVLGGGNAGSYGGVVGAANDCDSASLQGLWSVPLPATTPNLALRFNFKGSGSGEAARLRADMPTGSGVIASNLSGGVASFTAVSICVPEYAKGQSGALAIDMPQGTTCSIPQPAVRQFAFDDFQLATDMNCPAQAYILDGDFERTAPGSPWIYSQSTPSMTTGGVLASGANHYASISAKRLCNDATARQYISVPPIPNGQFYRIQFSYRTTESGGGAKFTANTPGKDVVLASTAGAWSTGVVCLGSNSGVAMSQLTFGVAVNGAGNCGDTLTTQTLDIDDVVGAVKTTCP